MSAVEKSEKTSPWEVSIRVHSTLLPSMLLGRLLPFWS
jgi:hypothetical protein